MIPTKDSLSRNIFANTANYVIAIALGLVVSPAMIHGLGNARYGIWALVGELTGYYGYLDLGIRSAVGYYVAQYLTQSKEQELNQTASTGLWSITALGALLGASGFLLALVFQHLFKTPGVARAEVQTAIILLAGSVGIMLPTELLNSLLNGGKRLDIVKAIDIVTRVVSTVALLWALKSGGGLIAVSVIQFVTKALTAAITYFTVRRVMPQISFSPAHWRWGSLKQLAKFGSKTLTINLSFLLSSRSDLVIVGLFLGVKMVTFYSIARSLIEYLYNGVRSITLSFTSHLVHLYLGRDRKQALDLFVRGARLSGLCAFTLTAFVSAFGRSFIGLWQGRTYVSGNWMSRSDVVLIILLAAFLPRFLQSLTFQLFIAAERLTFLVWIHVLEAVIKILLSLLLAPRWGMPGVALSNLLPMLLLQGMMPVIYLLRNFPLGKWRYLKESTFRPGAIGILVYLISAALVTMNEPSRWPAFLADAGVALAAGVALLYWLGLNKQERTWASDRGAALFGGITPSGPVGRA